MIGGGRSRRELVVASVVLLAATLVVTWPLAAHLTDRLTGSWDSFFGAWRLAWIADSAVSRELHFFNAPIFYPEPRALAFSDAILIPGLVFAPLRYLGLSPLTAYNIALVAAFVSSGLALYALARRLGVRWEAAIVGAVIYSLAPYRLDHLDHLEMQMAMWMPIGLLLWHSASERASVAAAAGAALSVALQWLSCIYYGILFAPVFAIGIAIEWTAIPKGRRARVFAAMAAAAVAGLVAIWFYSQPYLANRDLTGDRLAPEIARYSATLSSYFAVHPHNALYGGVSLLTSEYETRIFPGAIALILTGAGLIGGPWNRRRLAYVAMGLMAFDLSLGANGLLFPLLREYAVPYRGLRAPARAGVIVLMVVSVIAAQGMSWILDRTRAGSLRSGLLVLAVAMLLVEYRTPPDLWEVTTAPDLPQLGLTRNEVLLEMPIATPERFDLSRDADYMLTRVGQWPHLVNGYSGYYPPDYITMAERTKLFPDTRAIREIARIGVTVLTVHERWYGERYKEVVGALEQRTDVEPLGKYSVFLVNPQTGLRDIAKEVAVFHVKPLEP